MNWSAISAGLLALLAAPILMRIVAAIVFPLILLAAVARTGVGLGGGFVILTVILLLILQGRRARRVEANEARRRR